MDAISDASSVDKSANEGVNSEACTGGRNKDLDAGLGSDSGPMSVHEDASEGVEGWVGVIGRVYSGSGTLT